MWRVIHAELITAKFEMKSIATNSEPLSPTSPGLHTNPLEFIGYVINLWIAIKMFDIDPPAATGAILDLTGNNTTANSWMSYAATVPNNSLRHLSHVTSCLMVAASTSNIHVQSSHITGKQNKSADCLSRLENGRDIPSLEHIIKECSPLQDCRICLLPSKVLTILASLISLKPIGESYAEVTTELLTLARAGQFASWLSTTG